MTYGEGQISAASPLLCLYSVVQKTPPQKMLHVEAQTAFNLATGFIAFLLRLIYLLMNRSS